jgi:hypothetical protein
MSDESPRTDLVLPHGDYMVLFFCCHKIPVRGSRRSCFGFKEMDEEPLLTHHRVTLSMQVRGLCTYIEKRLLDRKKLDLNTSFKQRRQRGMRGV